jgi:hypothetical protein
MDNRWGATTKAAAAASVGSGTSPINPTYIHQTFGIDNSGTGAVNNSSSAVHVTYMVAQRTM